MFYISGATVHTIEIVHYIKRKKLKEIIDIEVDKRFEKNGTSIYNLEQGPYKTTITFHKCNVAIYCKVDLVELAGKEYLDERDFLYIDDKIKTYIYNLIKIKLKKIIIKRYDFRIDFKVSLEIKKFLIDVLGKYALSKTNEYIRNSVYYPETVYYNSEIGKEPKKRWLYRIINGKKVSLIKLDYTQRKKIDRLKSYSKVLLIYDKYKQSGLEKYKDVLRFEISLGSKHLYYGQNKHGRKRTLQNYLNKSLCHKYFIENLSKVIEPSTFYKLEDAKKLIMGSNIKKKDEVNIFISNVNKHSLEIVYQNLSAFNLTEHKYKRNIRYLNSIDINILCIQDNITDPIPNPIKLIENYLK